MRCARVFLDGGTAPIKLSETVAEALIDALVRRREAGRLALLAAGVDKALAKRARRGLHLLRARGVAAEIPVKAGGSAVKFSSPEFDLPSLVSAVLRDGDRVIWCLLPNDGDGGFWVYQAFVTETEGLTNFEIGTPMRRKWREAEQELMLDRNLSIVRIPQNYACGLIEEAFQSSLAMGLSPPREYAEVRHKLPKVVPSERHPALDRAPELRFTDAELLHVLDLPEARSWIPDEKIAREVYVELEQLGGSQLFIDERQRLQQAGELVRKACDRALAGTWRTRMVRRLLDTALVISLLPSRNAHEAHHDRQRDHERDAALCVAASKQLEHLATSSDEAVVARALFARLLPKEALSDEPADLSRSGELIITP